MHKEEPMTITKGLCFGVGILVVGCSGGPGEASSNESAESALAPSKGGGTPVITVSPNPIQAGSIAITKPTVVGKGFGSGKNYSVQLTGGYDETALQTIACSVTA
jgi:hypothetical protein